VLVHGTMGKSEDWSRVVEELSNSRPVIRPNYIERVAGGNSTNELAIKDLADEVVAAVRGEGRRHFDLVGGSLGAALATCIAAEYPEMVRSLVLVSGFSHGSDPRMNLQFKLWLRLASTDKVLEESIVQGFEESKRGALSSRRPSDKTVRQCSSGVTSRGLLDQAKGFRRKFEKIYEAGTEVEVVEVAWWRRAESNCRTTGYESS
jgi:pimeloyl-ACP methyl ester carboxylesterase